MIGSPFLKLVAEDLYRQFSSCLSDIVVVFPNNRAQLFFNEHLYSLSNKPIWTPSYTTIKELFQTQSHLQVPDTIELVCRLYAIYTDVVEKNGSALGFSSDVEPLDQFYHWGEIILHDFEDVDSDMVDAKQLFQNIKDNASFETDGSFLDEEQINSIREFFRNFTPETTTKLKENFLRLWNILMPLYEQFKSSLKENNLAYEGMMKREVVDTIDLDRFPAKKYVFVGFNVLNKCERMLFKKLESKALYYWDCDEYYMNCANPMVNHEAARFMAQNLVDFPNALKSKYDNLNNTNRKVSIISASTETAQAKYIKQYLTERRLSGAQDRDTAIVLCNESLLLPVLHSIPVKENASVNTNGEKEEPFANITMGLPLIQTPIYGLLQVLLDYQGLRAYYSDRKNTSLSALLLLPILRNHYLREVFPELRTIELEIQKKRKFYKIVELEERCPEFFQSALDPSKLLQWMLNIVVKVVGFIKPEGNQSDVDKRNEVKDSLASSYDDLYVEAIYRVYTVLQRLMSLYEGAVLSVDFHLMCNLLDKLFSSISVPFSGDELEGVQIMGFLETRNLDFSNVILLSANEGTLPNSGKDSSFIPYSLRFGFGMTTIEHKNSLYAYYFYRLLQRADNITMMYNISTDGSSKGQMSRFLMQLMVESNYAIDRKNIMSDISLPSIETISATKTEAVMDKIRQNYDLNYHGGKKYSISPSAFNVLLQCPLRFYMQYILNIRKENELSDEVENSDYGSIFHSSMQQFYEGFRKGDEEEIKIEKVDLENLDDSLLEKYVRRAFNEVYFKVAPDATPEYTGNQLMNKEAVLRAMHKMLSIDHEYAPFTVVSMEREYSTELEVPMESGNPIRIKLKGTIDRVDRKGDVVRILDYKTGGSPSDISSLESLFDRDVNNHYPLQVLLYSYLFTKTDGNQSIHPKPVIAFLKSCRTLSDLDFVVKPKKDDLTNNKVILQEGVLEDSTLCFEGLIENVRKSLQSFFDPSLPFEANKSENACKYCDLKSLCGCE